MKTYVRKLTVGLLTLLLLWTAAVPAAAAEKPARVVDAADLLEEYDEEELLETLDEISRRQACDVAVVTVDSLDGKTPEAYADDFYDENGYGIGAESDGILLLLSMEERDWQITTCGFGITAFTDAGLDYIADEILPMLGDGDYAGAFGEYASLCDLFLEQARTGEPYDVGHLPDDVDLTFEPFAIVLFYAVGLLLAWLQSLWLKAKLRPVAEKSEAVEYKGKEHLNIRQDRMVHSYITTRQIPKDPPPSSGGSTTHTSSSGTTHGGSGGKF